MGNSVSIDSVDSVLATVSQGPDERADGPHLEALYDRARAVAGDPVAALGLAREAADVLPLPGDGEGATARRWSALATLGAADLTVARAVEPHLDALAIVGEAEREGVIDRAALPRGAWGVFAAESSSARLEAHGPAAPVTAAPAAGAERVALSGTKPWCSLAGHLDAALVTAWTGERRGLFAVSMREPGVRVASDASRWVSRGLRAVESLPVAFDGVAAVPVGPPDWYLRRPGFAWGGIGVAAIWFGAAVAIARRLLPAAVDARFDDLARLHLGEAERTLRPARAMLAEAARLIDAGALRGRQDAPARLATTARAAVARAVDDVVARTVRATGPAPLAFDEEHARRVADLGIYVRQEHGERDAVALGTSLAAPVADPAEASA